MNSHAIAAEVARQMDEYEIVMSEAVENVCDAEGLSLDAVHDACAEHGVTPRPSSH